VSTRNRFNSAAPVELEQILFQDGQFEITSQEIKQHGTGRYGGFTNTFDFKNLRETRVTNRPNWVGWEIIVGLFFLARGGLLGWTTINEATQNGWLATLILFAFSLLLVFGGVFFFERAIRRDLYYVILVVNRPSFRSDPDYLEVFSSSNRTEADELAADIESAYKALKKARSVMLTP
jgi:hypothetical protein